MAWSVPAATDSGDQGVQARLNDRTVPGRDGRDLQFVRVDSPDVVTVGGETGGGDGADIAEPEDGDLHVEACDGRGKSPRQIGAIPENERWNRKQIQPALFLVAPYVQVCRPAVAKVPARPIRKPDGAVHSRVRGASQGAGRATTRHAVPSQRRPAES